jgi:hypothetical protein
MDGETRIVGGRDGGDNTVEQIQPDDRARTMMPNSVDTSGGFLSHRGAC